jgi:putative flippase GtrA
MKLMAARTKMLIFLNRCASLAVWLSFGLLSRTLATFLVVGSLGVAVHLTVLQCVLHFTPLPFQAANLISMLVAATSNYLLNNRATFADLSLEGRKVMTGYFIYLGVTGAGLAMSLAVSSVVYAHCHIASIAALSGIVLGSLWNYFMSHLLVWKLLSRTKSGAEVMQREF